MVDDEIAEKMMHTDNIPKHMHTLKFLDPIIGKTSLITVSGDYWKKVRKMFNPAFSTSHLESLVPGMIEEILVFVDLLEGAAKSDETLLLGILLPVYPPYLSSLTV
jgi:cytochrome P450